jgi:hypothetical protein
MSAIVGGWCNCIGIGGCLSFTGGGYRNIHGPTGFYNTIGGGLCNSNSGCYYTTISGGQCNCATGNSISIGGGVCNLAVQGSTISGGCKNTASGCYSFIGGGVCNFATCNFTSIGGGIGACSYRYGQRSFAAGFNSSVGDSQQIELIAKGASTPSSGSVVLTLGGVAGQYINVPSGKVMLLDIYTLGSKSNGAFFAASQDYVVIRNDGGVTIIVDQSNIKQTLQNGYTVTISANDTLDTLVITGNSNNTDNVKWISYITGVELAW